MVCCARSVREDIIIKQKNNKIKFKMYGPVVAGCYTQKGRRGLVMVERSSSRNSVLFFMVGCCLKLEEQKVLGARQEKNIYVIVF